jgi:hypothetical protein
MDLPKEKLKELKECGQDYRILSYPYYAEDKVVLGMEEKDVKDICAIFLDHPIGNGKEEINPEKIKKVLKRDQKFALTVRLNLGNLVEQRDVLLRWLRKSEASTVADRIQTLLRAVPKVGKKWSKPWWNTAVETPIIE